MFIQIKVGLSVDLINLDHVKAIRWAGTDDDVYDVLFVDGDTVRGIILPDEWNRAHRGE